MPTVTIERIHANRKHSHYGVTDVMEGRSISVCSRHVDILPTGPSKEGIFGDWHYWYVKETGVTSELGAKAIDAVVKSLVEEKDDPDSRPSGNGQDAGR